MKVLLISLGIFMAVFFGYIEFIQPQNPSAKAWQQDLRVLQEELSNRHVDLYHTISQDSFDQAVDKLYHDIPDLSTPQILVRIAQVVAMVGDGHTSFNPGNQKRKWFKFFPITLWSFSDGMYVICADRENENLLGKKLVKIDNTSIDEAFEKVATTIGADNDIEYVYSVPFNLIRPELLHALSISHQEKMSEFFFDDGTSVRLKGISLKKYRNSDWRTSSRLYGGKKPPSASLNGLFATSLSIDHLKERKYYWYTFLNEDQSIYLQYNTCWDQDDRPTFTEMATEILEFMDSNPIERLVVDVRQNSGGEPLIAQYFIDEMAKRKEFTNKGRLFVITGRRTYSAALTNAAQLRARAGARIVGEASRGKPNNPSEGRDIDLKRTKIYATVSTQFVERDKALGDTKYLPVDIPVAMTYQNFADTEDVFLKAALNAELFSY